MGILSSFFGLFGGAGGGPTAPKALPPTKLAGSEALPIWGGWIASGERNPKLQGLNRWTTFDNVLQGTMIIAAALRVSDALYGSAKWTAEANPRGGKDAERAVDIVTEGLLDAQMAKPWPDVVRKTSTGGKFKGFAMHEWSTRKRSDGRIQFANIEHRPQWSIQQWDKPDERTPWQGVVQRTQAGGSYYLPRNRLFYFFDDTMTDNPDGVGYLRHLVEHAGHLERSEQLEGLGFETNLAGTPVGRAPLKKLKLAAEAIYGTNQPDKVTAYINAQTDFLQKLITNHIKTPTTGLMLDSQPFTTADMALTPSQVLEWGFEILPGTAVGQQEIRAAIKDIQRELARVMLVEWLMMGDSEGARAVHGDKTAMFGMGINGVLKQVGHAATRDLAWPLVALNGLDPDTCTPTLRAQAIPTETIQAVCQSLYLLAQAGAPIRPGDGAVNVIRDRMELPDEPEIDPAMLMVPRPGRGMKPGATPAGAAASAPGEVDVDVSDLGDSTAGTPKAGTQSKKGRR